MDVLSTLKEDFQDSSWYRLWIDILSMLVKSEDYVEINSVFWPNG